LLSQGEHSLPFTEEGSLLGLILSQMNPHSPTSYFMMPIVAWPDHVWEFVGDVQPVRERSLGVLRVVLAPLPDLSGNIHS
jgi:hypothetical protein